MCPHPLKAMEEEHTCPRLRAKPGDLSMDGPSPKREKEDTDGSDNSDDEQTRIDPFCVFKNFEHTHLSIRPA